MAIPKIIHYCWVGGNPKPQSVLYCIESWRKFCPDYEIREWNETNYDFTKNKYMCQAYEAKKWGFVPDYARLDIVYQHGGVYFDTDVELVYPLDELLENTCFFGFENTGTEEFFVNCGHGFGAEVGHRAIKAARDLYEHLSFQNPDSSLNLLASPYFTTQALRQIGLVQENKDQQLGDVRIYASDVLCPKNFMTGQLRKTARTVSIHHFSASWVDEKIKAELAHQQAVKAKWGNKLGGWVLYGESAIKKYANKEMIGKLPGRIWKKATGKLIAVKDSVPEYAALAKAAVAGTGSEGMLLLDTSMDSDNCGDGIIMENCLLQLPDSVNVAALAHVPTHRLPNEQEKHLLRNVEKKILCGTNILSGKMRSYGLWKMDPDLHLYKGTVLMGVGFDSTSDSFDQYSKMLLQILLDKNALHSVRDSFSERKLKSMGIDNVVNTGCPTMWCLTPEHCASIPVQKAKNVVCTITDYHRDAANDSAMLDILQKNYENVYLWLQGRDDLAHLKELGYQDKLTLIPSTLEAFDAVLAQDDLDYVGTRLHAGIRAISKGHRSLVISIDNRAACISADTGLPILKREDVPIALENRLLSTIETELTLPWDTIALWRKQFETEL